MHWTTLVIVPDAQDAEHAITRAEAALDPFYFETNLQDIHSDLSDEQVQKVLHKSKEGILQDFTLQQIKGHESARWLLAREVGQWYESDPSKGYFDQETGAFGTIQTYNPDGKYDWFEVGGRWTGYFKITDDADEDAHAHAQSKSRFAPVPLPGRADAVRIDALDVDGMVHEECAQAEAVYDRFEEVTAGLTPPQDVRTARANAIASALPEGGLEGQPQRGTDTLSMQDGVWGQDMLAWLKKNGHTEIHERAETLASVAVSAYRSSPWMVALDQAGLVPFLIHPLDYFEVNTGGRAAFLSRVERGVLAVEALLMAHTGEWIDDNLDRPEGESWAEHILNVVKAQESTAWLVLVDCHS